MIRRKGVSCGVITKQTGQPVSILQQKMLHGGKAIYDLEASRSARISWSSVRRSNAVYLSESLN